MKGKKKTGQNILHYVIASSVVIVFIIAILGGYLFRFYYKKMQEDFYKENSVYIGNIAKTHGNELQILQDISMQIALSDSARFLLDEQPTKSAALKKQLNQYRSVNQFFDVMYCYYQKDQYLFNHMTSISIDLFCDTAYQLENYSPSEVKDLLCAKQKKLLVLPEEAIEGELVYFYDVQAKNVIYIYPVAPKYDTILIFFIGTDHYDDLFADEQENTRNTWLYEQRQENQGTRKAMGTNLSPWLFLCLNVFSKEVKSPLLFDWTWFTIKVIRIRVDNVEMKKEELENDTFI